MPDNEAYYRMGEAYRALGETEEAARCFAAAAEGEDTPASAVYYNEQPSGYIYYIGPVSYTHLDGYKRQPPEPCGPGTM